MSAANRADKPHIPAQCAGIKTKKPHTAYFMRRTLYTVNEELQADYIGFFSCRLKYRKEEKHERETLLSD